LIGDGTSPPGFRRLWSAPGACGHGHQARPKALIGAALPERNRPVWFVQPEHQERLEKMGIKDGKRVYDTEDLAPGKQIIFACTGVTDGNLLRGVRFFGEGTRTHSLVVTLDDRQVRFIDTVHLDKRPDLKVRFA
jgi:fructose-1,6-bisphosphatase/sedoheptulose 1,7-bisphosphatase-like protein